MSISYRCDAVFFHGVRSHDGLNDDTKNTLPDKKAIFPNPGSPAIVEAAKYTAFFQEEVKQ